MSPKSATCEKCEFSELKLVIISKRHLFRLHISPVNHQNWHAPRISNCEIDFFSENESFLPLIDQIYATLFSMFQSIFINDYVPNDKRPLNINLKVVQLNINLSKRLIHNDYDWANNSREWICNTNSIEINAFGLSTLPVPTARQQLLVTLLRLEILTCCH